MNLITRKIALSILTLTFTLITFTTATLAWFTLATTNTIDGIQLNVTLGDDLEISLDGINYYQIISSSLIENYLEGLVLNDITSLNGFEFYNNDISKTVQKNIDYLSITFYFRTLHNRLKYVYLANNISSTISFENPNGNGTFFTSRGQNWRADISFVNDFDGRLIEKGTIKRYHATDALRLSFIEELVGDFDNRDESTLIKMVYDPSGDQLRGFGKPYGAIAYWNTKNNQLLKPPIGPTSIFALSTIRGGFSDNTDSRVSELIPTPYVEGFQQFYVGKTTINIWLEGWDADCFDAILTDLIKMQLQFQAAVS